MIQGECRVGTHPDAVLSTLLGSCVAACIFDPVASIGGMNHFLLPGRVDQVIESDRERYGVHAMEMLINDLLKGGADRHRLQVKLFGGAKTVEGLVDVGAQNARFAHEFLRREGMPVVGECLGGLRGRKIQFWPASGRARRIFMAGVKAAPAPLLQPAGTFGAVELF